MLNCMSFIGMSERKEKHIFNASIDQKKKLKQSTLIWLQAM